VGGRKHHLRYGRDFGNPASARLCRANRFGRNVLRASSIKTKTGAGAFPSFSPPLPHCALRSLNAPWYASIIVAGGELATSVARGTTAIRVVGSAFVLTYCAGTV
jgi:hypothetical protein